ncbi:MAG: hypothetical protein Q4D79_00200 [Propionibacteriaceae bacterium]|nr:hypothetical protein [Propionibacteriaceae bacterium]
MPEITALASPLAILALVELAKSLGLSGRAATALAVTLGVVLAVTDHLLAGSAIYGAVTQGLVLGLGAAGLWDAAGRVGKAGAPGASQ